MKHISGTALIHPMAHIEAQVMDIGDNVIIEEGVSILCQSLKIDAGTIIKKGTSINFREIKLGFKSIIEENSHFKSLKGQGSLFCTGDFSFLGYNQKLFVPHFEIGDYTTIHNSNFTTGHSECIIGHNCWIGQESILNSNKKLSIGNNVGIGTNSQLWTHVIHGELLEGCTMYGEHPLTIEDDVWIVGGAVISPNLVIRQGSVIMVGSVLTKNTEPWHCYAGVPAKDITDKLNPYRKLSIDEKFDLMKKFIEDFNSSTEFKYSKNILFLDSINELNQMKDSLTEDLDYIVIIKEGHPVTFSSHITVFSIETKFYTKNRTLLEEKFMKFHKSFRAKFIPVNS